MSQPFDPVFGHWYTDKRLGSGTDGRVYSIIKKDENGESEHGILKTIRIAAGRSEDKGFNSIGEKENLDLSEENFNKIIKSITDNIETIRQKDNGKHFVNYEQWEIRDTSDGKGKLLMVRLEEMRSLSDLLSEFSFTLEETVSLGISICNSLKKCRSFHYIYPNLKPENILFDKNGICKLGDFGSFSILKPSKTSIAFKRTQYYSAPELVKTGKINSTCDTYSLGLVLYTLVNRGRLPFAEMYPQEVTLNGLNRSVENRVNGLPLAKPKLCNDALFAVISKACAFKPQDRYLTPSQMLADLKNVLDNKPFEKTQYEDIYSKSDSGFESESLSDKSTIIKKEYEEKAAKTAASKQPEKKVVPSLRDEITIPNVHPKDYSKSKPTAKKKSALPVASYAFNKPIEKNESNADIKKIIAIIISIVIVFTMLIVSLTMRHNNNKEELLTNNSVSDNAEVNFGGGTND